MLNLGGEMCPQVVPDTRRDAQGCLGIRVEGPIILFFWYVDVVPGVYSSGRKNNKGRGGGVHVLHDTVFDDVSHRHGMTTTMDTPPELVRISEVRGRPLILAVDDIRSVTVVEQRHLDVLVLVVRSAQVGNLYEANMLSQHDHELESPRKNTTTHSNPPRHHTDMPVLAALSAREPGRVEVHIETLRAIRVQPIRADDLLRRRPRIHIVDDHVPRVVPRELLEHDVVRVRAVIRVRLRVHVNRRSGLEASMRLHARVVKQAVAHHASEPRRRAQERHEDALRRPIVEHTFGVCGTLDQAFRLFRAGFVWDQCVQAPLHVPAPASHDVVQRELNHLGGQVDLLEKHIALAVHQGPKDRRITREVGDGGNVLPKGVKREVVGHGVFDDTEAVDVLYGTLSHNTLRARSSGESKHGLLDVVPD